MFLVVVDFVSSLLFLLIFSFLFPTLHVSCFDGLCLTLFHALSILISVNYKRVDGSFTYAPGNGGRRIILFWGGWRGYGF